MQQHGSPSDSGRPTQTKEPERPSFDTVFRRGVSHVRHTLLRLGVPEAECDDATQEVFLVVLRLLPRYEERGALLAWLSAIARNVAASRRRPRREVPVGDADAPNSVEPALLACIAQPDPQSPEHLLAVRRLVVRLLDATELDRRVVLVMHVVDDLPVPTIARALGIPEGTAWTRLRLARRDLEAAYARLEARDRSASKILGAFSPIALLASERQVPPLAPDVQESLRARLSSALELPRPDGEITGVLARDAGASAARRGVSALIVAKVAIGAALLFSAGVLTGALLDPLHRDPRLLSSPPLQGASAPASSNGTASVERSAPSPSPASAASPSAANGSAMATSSIDAGASDDALETKSARATGNASAAASGAAGAAPSNEMAVERALMTKAASALASSDTQTALAALDEHARLFRGGGRLAAERETYWITALLRAGRRGEARDRIERFARNHPRTPRLEELRRAVGDDGDPPSRSRDGSARRP